MIIYNYITTNKINGKQYIGMHSTDNVDDNYLGSGKLILRAFKKYGKNNFIREIICTCESPEEANKNEKIYIEKYNTLYPKGYNLSPTGGLGFKGCHSEEARKKMIGNKNAAGTIPSIETREKLRQTKIGNTWGFKKGNKIGVGKKATEETKKKLSLQRLGNKHSLGHKHSEETRLKMSLSHTGKIHPMSEETKMKISAAKKGRFKVKRIA